MIVLTRYIENYSESHDRFIKMLENQADRRNIRYTPEDYEEIWLNHLKEEYTPDEIWDVVQCNGYTKVIFPMGRHDCQHSYDKVCETKEYIDNKLKEEIKWKCPDVDNYDSGYAKATQVARKWLEEVLNGDNIEGCRDSKKLLEDFDKILKENE